MKKTQIQLSDHFTYQKLLRFVLPSIVMMVFTSIYGVVDGLFVSNFAGKTPFAAINLVMPFIMVLGGIGFMIGTGGTIGAKAGSTITADAPLKILNLYTPPAGVDLIGRAAFDRFSEHADLAYLEQLCTYMQGIDYSTYRGVVLLHGSDHLLLCFQFNNIRHHKLRIKVEKK